MYCITTVLHAYNRLDSRRYDSFSYETIASHLQVCMHQSALRRLRIFYSQLIFANQSWVSCQMLAFQFRIRASRYTSNRYTDRPVVLIFTQRRPSVHPFVHVGQCSFPPLSNNINSRFASRALIWRSLARQMSCDIA
jgi:hypothetical protein